MQRQGSLPLGCTEGGRVKELVTCQGHVTSQLSPTPSAPASLSEVSAWYFLSIENPFLPLR